MCSAGVNVSRRSVGVQSVTHSDVSVVVRVVDICVCCNAIVYGSRDSICIHHVFYNTVVRCVYTVVGVVREFRQFSHLYVSVCLFIKVFIYLCTDRKTRCKSSVGSFCVIRNFCYVIFMHIF